MGEAGRSVFALLFNTGVVKFLGKVEGFSCACLSKVVGIGFNICLEWCSGTGNWLEYGIY